MSNESMIEGRNAVLEAFRSGKTVDRLYVLDGCQDGPILTIKREAKNQDTIIKYVDKDRLDQMSQTGHHQGVIAVSAAYDYSEMEDIFALAEKKGEAPFVIILDGIRTSAGALNYTPVVKVTNLSKTIEELKEKGLWFVCADMEGEVMYDLNLTGPIGLVIGNEGEGVSRLVREKCDFVARIPMKGDIDSLNASVAMGVLSFEIARQRSQK